MRDSFEKVKTFLFIVTAPLWVGYWCLFMILILPFYLLYELSIVLAARWGRPAYDVSDEPAAEGL